VTPSYSAHALPNQHQPWHTYTSQQTLEILDSNSEAGLTLEALEQRQKHYGPNELEEAAGRSSWEIFLDQFKNIMLIMLIVVAIVSGVLDLVELREAAATGVSKGGVPFKDTIAIMLIVVLNGILGYLQESRAEKALAALKRLSSPKVQVIREGKRQEVDAPTLVPGDIMLLEAGDQLAADGQLLEASNLRVRESALTGESQPVSKSPLPAGLEEDTPVGDRFNMVFTGTEIIQGRGKVVVTNTGMETELGKIAQLLQGVESEPTPLQQRMTQLGNVLVTGSLILVAIVVVAGVVTSGWDNFRDLIEISLSMAVAVVPEGLPAVITVTLALGTQRMVRRQALIRKLPAVETLGSVNVICSDKTGTLTQNKMVVQEVETASDKFRVTGEGYAPNGEFLQVGGQAIQPADYPGLQSLLLAATLCNDAHLSQGTEAGNPSSQEDWQIIGDPTEGALLSLSGKGGLEQQSLKHEFPRSAEFPFSSERKRMSVIVSDSLAPIRGTGTENFNHEQSPYLLFVKGSPELVLELCHASQQERESLPLSEAARQEILKANEDMAGRGLRVLGFAYKPIADLAQAESETAAERELIWLGLAGMLDAPRPEVREAVATCRLAGIRPIMITGDHQLTAQVIARDLGIAQPRDRTLTGRELERLSPEELEGEVGDVSVYARVSPEHKLRIVRALQKLGKFVAMTGDGVNDAPALKQADIGIAMGITGTDVSKEASDMILLDDNFATIVAATQEGRVVYNNIRLFIKYILGSNVGEVITIAAAPLILGFSGVPLTPLQILWMNLVTDGLPALALAVEPADTNIMRRPPFSPRESIFARGLGAYIIRIGIVFAIISISLMIWSYKHAPETGNPESWKTMVFTGLCLAQMGHAIAVRSPSRLTIEINPFSNPYLLGAVVLTTILQLMLIYVAPLRSFFGTQLLTQEQLLVCLGFSSLMFIWVELEKVFLRLRKAWGKNK
jgi:Ca2+-transporting ATPase